MCYRVLFAPHPPQFTQALTVTQLARRDVRFAQLELLRQRDALGAVVQDCADLLHAHVTLRDGPSEWTGTPGAQDEHGREAVACAAAGWSEDTLAQALALDLAHPRLHQLDGAAVQAELTTWPAGLVYVFGDTFGARRAGVLRRLNLTNFFDRLELEFLDLRGRGGWTALRAHRLAADGTYEVLRAPLQLASPAAPRRTSDVP